MALVKWTSRAAAVIGLVALGASCDMHGAKVSPDKPAEPPQTAAKQAARAPAKPADRYELPAGGVKELLAFIKDIRTFEPISEEEDIAHQNKALPAIRAAAEKILNTANADEKKLPGYDAVASLMLMIRAMEVAAAPPEEQQKLIADIKARLESREQLSQEDLSAALQVAQTFESGGNQQMAADAYRELGGALAKNKDEKIAKIGANMEGAARRITLLGKPLELSGTEVGGAKFDWDKYRGKVVLVDFWATWCGPCRAELPNVKKNYALYHDRGFEVVGISLDDDREALEKFLETEKNPWITLHDGGWEDNAVASFYGVMGIPTVILVDKEGKVVSTEARGEELGSQLAALLGPPGPANDGNTAGPAGQDK